MGGDTGIADWTAVLQRLDFTLDGKVGCFIQRGGYGHQGEVEAIISLWRSFYTGRLGIV
jgi:hypothetical protein